MIWILLGAIVGVLVMWYLVFYYFVKRADQIEENLYHKIECLEKKLLENKEMILVGTAGYVTMF